MEHYMYYGNLMKEMLTSFIFWKSLPNFLIFLLKKFKCFLWDKCLLFIQTLSNLRKVTRSKKYDEDKKLSVLLFLLFFWFGQKPVLILHWQLHWCMGLSLDKAEKVVLTDLDAIYGN